MQRPAWLAGGGTSQSAGRKDRLWQADPRHMQRPLPLRVRRPGYGRQAEARDRCIAAEPDAGQGPERDKGCGDDQR